MKLIKQKKRNKINFFFLSRNEVKKMEEKLIINSIFERLKFPIRSRGNLSLPFTNYLLINSSHECEPVDGLLERNQLFAKKKRHN